VGDGVGAGGAGGGGGGGAMGEHEADGGDPEVHDGVRLPPHPAQPAALRAVPAQGAPHPLRAPRARARVAALRPLQQARHPQGPPPRSMPPTLPPCLCLCLPELIWLVFTQYVF